MLKKIKLLLFACIAFCNAAMAQNPCAAGLNFTVSPNPIIFDCSGAPQTLSAQGAGSIRYNWEACGQVQNNSNFFVLFNPCFVTVYARDTITGCRDTAYVQAFQQQPLFVNVNSDTIGCSNPTGLLVANVTAGSGNYTYQWNTGQTTPSITVTQAGTYTVTVSDIQSGCTDVAVGTVGYNGTPSFNIYNTAQQPSCNASNGSISVTSNGQGVTYQWNNGQTSPSIGNLSPGQYCVVARDVNGCIRDTCFYLQSANSISLDSVRVNVPCNGQPISISILGVIGGTAPYTYLWSNGATTATITNLQALSYYTVTVTSANGCTTVGNYSTYSGNPIYVFSTQIVQPACGANNGSIAVQVQGGQAPYTYTWSNGTNGNPATGLTQGVYSVTVTEATGCTGTSIFTLGSQSNIVATTTTTPASCNGLGSATATANAANVVYAWSNGATGSTITAAAGTYIVTATSGTCSTTATAVIAAASSNLEYGFLLPDGAGTSVTNTINVSGNAGATISSTNPVVAVWANMEHSYRGDVTIKLTCPTGANVILKSNSGGGTVLGHPCDAEATPNTRGVGYPFLFSASGTSTLNTATNTTSYNDACSGATLQALEGGNYLPENPLSGFNGCPLDGAWTITVSDALAVDNGYLFDWGLQLPGGCNTTNNFGSVLTSVGNTATYTWSNGQTTPTLQNAPTGTYTATITDGCSSITANVTIPNSNLSFAITPAACTPNAVNGSISINFAGTQTPTAVWSNGQTGLMATGLATGWYSVTITSAGCVTQRNIFVPASTSCVATITGFVLNDSNANCIKDAADIGVSNIMIRCTNVATGAVQYDFTDAQGFYTFRVDTGRYVINYYTTACDGYSLTCPSSGNINVTAALPNTIYANNNFFRTASTGTYSLSTSVYKSTARPGFGQNFTIYYRNNNSTAVNATLTFTHDPLLTNFTVTSGATPVYNAGTRTATWTLNLAANASGSVNVRCDMAQSVAVGLPVNGSIGITAAGTDICPNDNSENWTSITTNSFDPNDKQITVRQNASQMVSYNDHAGKDLLYQIRFQNTGTDTAYSVVIRDTLNASVLDISSLKLVGSTHNCTMEWESNNILKLHFYNINLPHRAANDAKSQGHAVFSVRTRTGTAASGQVVLRNRAAIYFDYNTPIITNQVTTTLMPPLAVEGQTYLDLAVKLYPNPTDNEAVLSYDLPEQTTLAITLLDMNGRLIRTIQANSKKDAGTHQANIEVNDLPAGIYLVQFRTDKGVQTHKLVRQ
jgi:subtilisin-like proprotein convertase family protein